MKERGILFSTDMVKAILDGRKTMTRRVIKPQPPENCSDPCFDYTGYGFFHEDLDSDGDCLDSWPEGDSGISCPYGVPGDRLYVRERFCYGEVAAGDSLPEASDPIFISQCKDENDFIPYEVAIRSDWGIEEVVWKPSIHMPKKFARIWLEITDVRVERIQDISQDDIMLEGVKISRQKDYVLFPDLWESTYPGSWEKNDFVWVVEFKRINP